MLFYYINMNEKAASSAVHYSYCKDPISYVKNNVLSYIFNFWNDLWIRIANVTLIKELVFPTVH